MTIPRHIIQKAKDAAIENWVLHEDWEHDKAWAQVTAALEAVAADIWEEGYAACYAQQLKSDRWPYPDEDEQAEEEYAATCGQNAAARAHNPHRQDNA